MYLIKSLKHSSKGKILYWAPEENGYTDLILGAGTYSEEHAQKIKKLAGKNSVELIPLTDKIIKRGHRQVQQKLDELKERRLKLQNNYVREVVHIENEERNLLNYINFNQCF